MGRIFDGIEERVLACLPALRRYALALTRNEADAEDLVQETLSRAIAGAQRYRRERAMLPWLLRIQHNAYVSSWRRRRRELPLPQATETGPDEAARRHEIRQVLTALESLPEDQRQAVTLIGLEELSYNDAADVLGIPKGTLMSRLARGREALKLALEGRAPPLRVVKGDKS